MTDVPVDPSVVIQALAASNTKLTLANAVLEAKLEAVLGALAAAQEEAEPEEGEADAS